MQTYGQLLDQVSASLWRHGPLGTAKRACDQVDDRARHRGLLAAARKGLRRGLTAFQAWLDGTFDRRRGTDTSGMVPLAALLAPKDSARWGIWYEPMSPDVFGQILRALEVPVADRAFVDDGAGKGRVLILAAEAGFRGVLGVEFSPELADIAAENIGRHEERTGTRGVIELACADATVFAIPVEPAVLFMFSPFTGPVMRAVTEGIAVSFQEHPRPLSVVFYGANPESLGFLQAMGFEHREVKLSADWTRFTMHRAHGFPHRIGESTSRESDGSQIWEKTKVSDRTRSEYPYNNALVYRRASS